MSSPLPLAAAGAALCLSTLISATPLQGEATYEVRFEATWSSTTHPAAYPAGAHFSPLVGATHSAAASLWQPGGLATPGIEVMAETGGTSTLAGEINGLIAAGSARELVLGSGIGSPASTSVTLTVSTEHPLVSLVTMIAPSPDWFVGSQSLSLLENGAWVDSKTLDLFAWDAGTDSGTTFTGGDQDTNPADPISLITGGPFFGTVPLGTYTFTRLSSSLVYGCGVNPAGSLSLVSGTPTLGQSLTLGLADPTGAFATPASTFVAVSASADPAFPCGTVLPGFGLGLPGAAGELLIGAPALVEVGPAYTGATAPVVLQVPNQPSLVGQTVFAQGLLVDPTARFGLTEAIELVLGS